MQQYVFAPCAEIAVVMSVLWSQLQTFKVEKRNQSGEAQSKKRRSSEVQTRVAQSCQRFMLWIPSASSQLVIPRGGWRSRGSGGEEWRKEEDNQRWIVKRKTNPLRALLSQTRTSVSCKKKAHGVAQSLTDFYFHLLSVALDGQGPCSYYKTLNSMLKMLWLF